MEFHFNPSLAPLPYGIVAINLLLKNPSLTLKPDAKLGMCRLLVSQKNTLVGESTVARYLARSAKSTNGMSTSTLYPEATKPMLASAIDGWLDEVSAITDVKKLESFLSKVSSSTKTAFLAGAELSLADIAAWSIVKSYAKFGQTPKSASLPAVTAWIKRVDSVSECSQALKIVDQLVGTPATQQSTAAKTSGKEKEAKKQKGGAVPQPTTAHKKLSLVLDKTNPLKLFRDAIGNAMSEVSGIDPALISEYLEVGKGAVADLAELCIPIPRLRMKGNPQQIAVDIAAKMKPDEYIREISATNIFVNFRMNSEKWVTTMVQCIHDSKDKFGENTSLAGQNVVVEFSSPNIAKPFHAGHLRSTIIGSFCRNVLRANGAKTTAINYLGDWGKQYGLLAVGFQKYGSEDELTRDPIRHLFDVYVKVNEDAKQHPEIHDQARAYFKKMEDGEPEALGLWKRFRELSIEKYKQIYARLGIEFDVYSGESQFSEGMIRALNHLTEKKLLTESDGAMIVDLSEYKMSPAIVQKADGATLYITRDIAAAWERHEKYNFDQMLYVVASQQDLHFQQLFKILELSGFDWYKKCQHVNFGLVKGMSTRKGTVVFLEDILDEAQSVMHSVMKQNTEKYARISNPEHTANIIGLSAVMVQDMAARRVKDYDFYLARMTSFEGDTGTYIQYSHTRLCSIERVFLESLNKAAKGASYTPPLDFDMSKMAPHLTHPKIHDLMLMLSQYPEVISLIPQRQFEPCNLVTYLLALCHKVSTCVEEVYVMNQEPDVSLARFWVYWSARVTLGNGMRILGLKPLEAM